MTLVLAIGAWVCTGQAEPIVSGEVLEPAEPVGDGQGILVMFNGNVTSGHIVRLGENFQIKTPTSTILVPGSAVKLHAANLQDAYITLRKQIPAEGGEELHLNLARWCLTQKLIPQARQELKTILQTDPEFEAARELLRKIDEILNPPVKEKGSDVQEKLKAVQQGLNLVEEQTTLAGMSREVGAEYTRRVQPIVMNGCALASCHGPQGPSKLQLHRVRAESGLRNLTESNLLKLTKFIDREHPDESPLLKVPQGSHGLKGKPVFAGSTGLQQHARLRDWVRLTAHELNRVEKPKRRNKAKSTDVAAADPSKADEGIEEESASETMRTAELSSAKPKGPLVQASAEKPAGRTGKPAPDPFDPEAFNRGVR